MKFKNSFFIVPLIFFLSYSNFTRAIEALTPGEMECFTHMIILHMANKGSIVKEDDAFGLHNSVDSLPFPSEMKSFLKNNPRRSNEIWECLKMHKKLVKLQKFKKLLFQVNILLDRYGKMFRSQVDTFPISDGLQKQIHNLQCVMDLMVREELEKMGTPYVKIYRIHLDLIAKLDKGEIKISQKGKVWLHNCTIPEVLTISVEEGHILRLHESHRYSLIWTKMPLSNKLFTGITLKRCIKIRKVPFVKTEAHGGNQDEYIDIETILSQGNMELEDKLKMKLDKQQNCLMEFLYSKYGLKYFVKMKGFSENDLRVNNANDYVFKKNTEEEAYLVTIKPELDAFLASAENDEKIFAEGSAEFSWLKNCGVSMTSKENGKNVFDLHLLIGLYKPRQMLIKQLLIDDLIRKEKYIGQINSSTTSTAAGEADICPICREDFSDGADVAKLPCKHIFHDVCIHTWIKSMDICPICRQDVLHKALDKALGKDVLHYNQLV